ncbi:hypothetical protein D3C83_166720 [compost metagenome]
MILRLQRHKRLGAQAHRLFQQRDVEIRHTDMPREAVALRLRQRPHRFRQRNVVDGGPMDVQEIDAATFRAGSALT